MEIIWEILKAFANDVLTNKWIVLGLAFLGIVVNEIFKRVKLPKKTKSKKKSSKGYCPHCDKIVEIWMVGNELQCKGCGCNLVNELE